MAIDGVSQVKINALTDKLLTNDDDKQITKKELFSFVSENAFEFVSFGLSSTEIQDEIIKALDKNYVGDNQDGGTTEAKDEPDFLKQYNELKEKVDKLQEELDGYISVRADLVIEQEAAQKELEAQENKYTELQQQLKQENETYKKVIDSITETTQNLEADVARKQQDAVYEAMSSYNPAQDGEWNEYVQKYMGDLNITSQFMGTLLTLTNKSEFLEAGLNTLGANLSAQAKLVNTAAVNYADVTQRIADTDDLIETTSVSLDAAKEELSKSIFSLISEQEMAFVTQQNLDLAEKLPDGKPRYIFAKGKEDGIFHIYDMAQGASLARQYGTDGGFDIICSGNGYINDFTDGGEDEYFYFDDCNQMAQGCCSYTTCSPLSLDLNGDGVKTSSKVIDYDIDGDGKLDKINDSADAVLVFDKDHDGIAGANGSEAFGNNTDLDGDGKADGYKDGFEALKALAKKEGLIGGNDNTLDEKDLKILEEKWGLGIKKGGYTDKTSSLADSGISEINLAQTNETTLEDNFDGNGNQLMRQDGATFKINGKTREYADIWHKKLDEDSVSSAEIDSASSSALSLNFDEVNEEISKNIAKGDSTKLESAMSEQKSQAMFDSNLFKGIGNDKFNEFKKQQAQEAEQKEAEKLEKEKLEEKNKK